MSDRRTPHPICVQLAAVRAEVGLSLDRVECVSDGVWKAVTVGSYERGDRQPTVARADALLRFYGYRLAIVRCDDGEAG